MKATPKFTAFVAASIDGRIAKNASEKSNTWTSKEDWDFFQKSLESYDAVVVGHNTYKAAKENIKKRNAIVFTRRVPKVEMKGNITFLNPKTQDVGRFFFKSKYRTVAILGGPTVYDLFLKKKMLSYLFLTIEPVVFGEGIPMLSGIYKKQEFTLQSVKKLNKRGTLLLKYKYGS
jgi:dihydrofolate reductase